MISLRLAPSVRRRTPWAAAVVAAASLAIVAGPSRADEGPGANPSATGQPPPSTPVPMPAPSGTTPPGPAATTPPGPRVTITAVGDTMLGNTPQLPPDPFSYMRPVEEQLHRNSQILFMNLEGTLTAAGGSKCSTGSSDCYAFRSPPSYGKAYKDDGFMVANSANNHYNDFGTAGQTETAHALKSAGIVQTGRPGQIGVVSAGGVTVAFLGFAPYTWASSLLDFTAARALIRRARERADQVVVYMHAGAEGATKTHITGASEFAYGENRGNPKAFAHMAIDAGANLVIGSGPHVLRGMEYYRNRLIAYSLGNFAGFHNFGSTGVTGRSAILRVTLGSDGRFAAGRVFPVALSGEGRPAPGGPSLQMIRSLSLADFHTSAVRFHDNGALIAP